MLNREPMGMKLYWDNTTGTINVVSVLNREPMGMKPGSNLQILSRTDAFQCSTASRWG